MGNKRVRPLATILLAAAVAGCSTITITRKGEQKLTTPANFEKSYDYFLWGIVNDHDIDVKDACRGGKVEQMQTQYTFVDALLGICTLGIYSPRTAKVWCQ